MTDRELLEAAAKTAGLSIHRWGTSHQTNLPMAYAAQSDGRLTWSPLSNDGDALRLAVVLGIDLCFGNDKVCADGEHVRYTDRADGAAKDEDRLAATRRAIVRAAAAMAA